ncbi:MAG: histidine kinase, partial [Phaeodactylibacter sp.]|nr:histidine kinase [Phaeodactylibacter sp.]
QIYGVEFIDEQHRAWAKSGEGVFVFDPLLQQFDVFSFKHLNGAGAGLVFNIVEWKSPNELIIAPRGTPGVLHYNQESRDWSLSKAPDALLGEGAQLHTRHVAWSPEGELTLCYFGGILLYNPNTRTFRPFPSLPPVKLRRFQRLLWDSQGRLWVATFDEGICRWDPQTKRWRVFREEIRSKGPNLLSMSFNYPMEDSRSNIWFKREQGFGVYLSRQDSFIEVNYSQQPDRCFLHINNLVEDHKGRVWMNSTDGLIGYAEVAHPEKGLAWKMDMNQLPNIYVKDIWELRIDPKGDIWGWGEKALAHVSAEDLSVTQYDFKYGGDNSNYSTFEILSSGAFAFGGKRQITLAEPDELRYNQEAPQPYLTGIDILEEAYSGPVAAPNLHSLTLRHWQNFFSFDFSAKGYTFGKQNRFRYRLKGFDEHWIMAKGRRNANYTNVPSGEYVFQLQAANNEGVWNETLYELPVFIATPWWKRWWAIVGALALAALLGYRLYRYRVGQIRKEEKLKAEFEKCLADVEMSALRAQMNPHFLFNSLNSIDSFIIKNETRKASEYLNNFARLIRLILQNSRTNYVSLKDELEAIELYLQMENLRFRDKFTYEIRVDENVDPSLVDIPPMLIQPYVENAIWHGLMHKEDKSLGKVVFSVCRENGYLKCVIEDNGIGREKAREIKARRPLRGQQSYGMRITRDRIDIINKLYNSNTSVQVIDLKDKQQNPLGTRVELCIPV